MYIIISPLKTEVGHFLKRLGLKKSFRKKDLALYRGAFCGNDILVAITGMGKDSSIRNMKMLFSYLGHIQSNNGRIEMIILTGFCGSLTEDLKVGDIVIYKDLINLEKQKGKDGFFRSASLVIEDPGLEKILSGKNSFNIHQVEGATVPEVIGKTKRKKRLKENHHCEAIDMESYWIAKNIDGRVRFMVARAVSDDMKNDFPEGRFLILKMIFSIFKPGRKQNLISILGNMEKARRNISDFLEKVIRL